MISTGLRYGTANMALRARHLALCEDHEVDWRGWAEAVLTSVRSGTMLCVPVLFDAMRLGMAFKRAFYVFTIALASVIQVGYIRRLIGGPEAFPEWFSTSEVEIGFLGSSFRIEWLDVYVESMGVFLLLMCRDAVCHILLKVDFAFIVGGCKLVVWDEESHKQRARRLAQSGRSGRSGRSGEGEEGEEGDNDGASEFSESSRSSSGSS